MGQSLISVPRRWRRTWEIHDPFLALLDVGRLLGRCEPIWNWIGYDEPNFTDTANGRKLLYALLARCPCMSTRTTS